MAGCSSRLQFTLYCYLIISTFFSFFLGHRLFVSTGGNVILPDVHIIIENSKNILNGYSIIDSLKGSDSFTYSIPPEARADTRRKSSSLRMIASSFPRADDPLLLIPMRGGPSLDRSILSAHIMRARAL